jgi:two-component system sensor histidine kinase KdpD
VLGLEPQEHRQWLAPDQEQVLDILAGRAALAIERAALDEQAQQARLLRETDRLQKALLSTVSHNLRTPLASVTGTLGTLLEDIAALDESTRHELLENAYDQAALLNRLVGNLLDMTRLEAGVIHLKTEPSDLQDAVGAALAQLGGLAARRRIITAIPASLPMVPMDFVLIVQVLVNLLDNALKYSPPAEPIEIRASSGAEYLEVLICDRGPGIAPADLERVFEKFNRGGRAGEAGGFGLGLSICKGFVEAHGGRIWAEPRSNGGTVITFTLPLKKTAASGESGDEHTSTANPGN